VKVQPPRPKSSSAPLTAIFRLAMMRMVAEGRARKTLKRLMCCALTVRTRKNWYAKQAVYGCGVQALALSETTGALSAQRK
jgi:hypothetical protein